MPPVRPRLSALALAENRVAAAENRRRLITASRNYEAMRKGYEAGE